MDINFLFSPFINFIDPQSKLYWGYLVSSILIILFSSFIYSSIKNFNFKSDFFNATSPNVLFHPSAILDYKYYFINTIFHSILFNHLVITTKAVSYYVLKLLTLLPISHNLFLIENQFIMILYTLCFWLAFDFGRFYSHYLLHKIPTLWNFHKFHHSAKVLNPLTVFRVHPVESILTSSFSGLFTGIITGMFYYIHPSILNMYTILGINIGIFSFYLYANLRHSQYWIVFPDWLSYIFLSPAQHQVHHSINPNHFNKNIGANFAIWDIIFNTLYIPKIDERISYGIEDENYKDIKSLWKAYVFPFKEVFLKK